MCLATIAKYLLCAFNLAFFLVGGAILGIGLWVYLDQNAYWKTVLNMSGISSTTFDVEGLLNDSVIILIVVGAVIFAFGFFGCCGAYRENKLCLLIYAVLVGLVVIMQIAAGICAAVYKDKAVTTVKTYMKKGIELEYEGKWSTTSAVSLAIDYLQVTLKCCGVDSYTDFYNATKWNRTVNKVENIIPVSCCVISNIGDFPKGAPVLANTTCTTSPSKTNSYYSTSCYDQIMTYINNYSIYVIGGAFGLVVLELLCIGAALYLRKSDDNKAV